MALKEVGKVRKREQIVEIDSGEIEIKKTRYLIKIFGSSSAKTETLKRKLELQDFKRRSYRMKNK